MTKSPPSDDPLRPARARAETERKRLMELAGGLLPASEAAGRLGVTTHKLTERHGQTAALVVPLKGEWLYPACQFSEQGLLPGVKAFFAEFGQDVDAWTRLAVLLARSHRFGRSALELLKEGRTAEALSIATSYAEMG